MVSRLEVINEGIGRLNANFERIERENYPNWWQFSAIGEAYPTKVPYVSTKWPNFSTLFNQIWWSMA
jgi:hypothetical protein